MGVPEKESGTQAEHRALNSTAATKPVVVVDRPYVESRVMRRVARIIVVAYRLRLHT